MESEEALTAIRLAAAVSVFAYASILDIRTRKVANRFWMMLSGLGIILLITQLLIDEQPLEYALVVAPILLILADIFLELKVEDSTARYVTILEYASAIVITIFLALEYGSDPYFQHLLGVPVMMLFVVVMYMMDAIRGGADAKALISISILFPFYPAISSLPLVRAETVDAEILFPFSFVVLVTAAIIVALAPLGFLVTNAVKRDFRFPQLLLGYKVDAGAVGGKHVWLMERVTEGRHVFYTRPKRDENLAGELQALKAAGHVRVWVTPKIPFIVPILLGLLICAILGNPLLYLFNL